MKKLSIIVPAYNEEEVIELFYKKLKEVIDKITERYKYEIIFVDDGSKDNTLDKLKKLRGNPAFDNNYVRKRLTLEFLQEIEDWKRNRDQLIHALAKVPYDNEHIKEIALTGQEIVRILDNKTKSLNKYFDKKEGKK